jgi:hypothetical protein
VRTFVYEQLGLSKPGFWADWRKRTIEEPEPEGYQADEEKAPEVSQGPTKYEPVKFQGDGPSKKKQFENMKFEQPAPPPPEKGHLIHPDWAKLLNDQADSWFKGRGRLSGSSMIDLMRSQDAFDNRNIAAMIRAQGDGNIDTQGVFKIMAQYWGQKQEQRDRARAARPFGTLEPTIFDQMVDIYYKTEPIYKPATLEVLTQGTTNLVAKKQGTSQGTSIGQLNVSQNGYVSSPLIPQKQAMQTLGQQLAARERLRITANKSLQGTGVMQRRALNMSIWK